MKRNFQQLHYPTASLGMKKLLHATFGSDAEHKHHCSHGKNSLFQERMLSPSSLARMGINQNSHCKQLTLNPIRLTLKWRAILFSSRILRQFTPTKLFSTFRGQNERHFIPLCRKAFCKIRPTTEAQGWGREKDSTSITDSILCLGRRTSLAPLNETRLSGLLFQPATQNGLKAERNLQEQSRIPLCFCGASQHRSLVPNASVCLTTLQNKYHCRQHKEEQREQDF